MSSSAMRSSTSSVEVLGRHASDLRATLGAETLADHGKLVLDDTQNLLGVVEKVAIVGNTLVQLCDLCDKLVACEARQAAQTHLQDGLALDVVDAKALVHACLGLGVVARGADDVHDLVDVVDRDEQALANVQVLLGLVEVILRTTRDDVDLVVDVVAQHLTQGKGPRHAIYQRKVDDAKVSLQLRTFVQVVEHHLGHGALLEVDELNEGRKRDPRSTIGVELRK